MAREITDHDALIREISSLRLQLAHQTVELESANKEREQIESEAVEAKAMLDALRAATEEAKRARAEQKKAKTPSLYEEVEEAKREVAKVRKEKESVEQQRRKLEEKLARLVSSVNEWKSIAVQTTSKSAVLGEEKRLLWEAKYAEARRHKEGAEAEKNKAAATLQEIEVTKLRAEADGIRLQAELRLLEQTLRNEQQCNAYVDTNLSHAFTFFRSCFFSSLNRQTQTESCDESPKAGNAVLTSSLLLGTGSMDSGDWSDEDSAPFSVESSAAPSTRGSSNDLLLDQKIAEYEAMISENQLQIARMEAEVEQWMLASEQLKQLGEDAVIEVMHENEEFKAEISELVRKFDAETQRRKVAEKEVTQAQAALNRLQRALDDATSLLIDEFVLV
eukprot:TRINITY_DN3916_c0_g1_i1.p1 TRINITY_DN3916_c0_g1~~TRINITY_DN3916_c0_g1_i1.p1  ORF type:complete len:391 (-),score=94.75 TRINITY_DN3916_c0_g1_i1:47-1219(-)